MHQASIGGTQSTSPTTEHRALQVPDGILADSAMDMDAIEEMEAYRREMGHNPWETMTNDVSSDIPRTKEELRALNDSSKDAKNLLEDKSGEPSLEESWTAKERFTESETETETETEAVKSHLSGENDERLEEVEIESPFENIARRFWHNLTRERDGDYYRDLGISMSRSQQYDKAAICLEKSIEMGIYDEEVATRLGFAYFRLGLLTQAIAAFRKVSDTYGCNANVATLMGMAYAQSGQYSKAVDILEPATRENPDRFNMHFGLGLAHLKLGHTEEALTAWMIAARIRPDVSELRDRIWTLLDEKMAA
ncbi:MAG: tetratricopeptide repeat protein [Magnetococcales bacterium]|nr:tetratricopeptide repeat protein [Magnetococcales bacterium]